MSVEVLLTVSDGEQVRNYHRSLDGALTQIGQFLLRQPVEPAELAAIVADLGDKFGWSGEQPPLPADRPARVLPASRASKPAASAPPKKRQTYSSREQTAAERAAILDYIGHRPNCSRREIAEALWPDEKDVIRLGKVSYRMQSLADRLVLTPGSSPTDPDRFRLRNGDQP